MEQHPYQFNYDRINTWLLAIIVLIAAVIGHIAIRLNTTLHADEAFHAGQIWLFYDGRYELAGNITVPPTYHFIIGRIIYFTGHYHDNLLRLISLSIAILTIPVAYFVARVYQSSEAWLRTLQIYFTPLIFPYFFVLYTDIWSLLFVSLTYLLVLYKRPFSAGFAGAIALLIRQDNITWVGLAYLFICFESVYKFDRNNLIRLFTNAISKGVVFNLLFISFLIFVYLNGGVAIGDAAAHKMSAFNPSNIHVFLVCCWLLFIPLHITQLPKIRLLLQKREVIVGLIVGFLIYISTLKNTHSYNQIMYDYFIHNGLVHLLTDYPAIKAISYIFAAWSLLSLWTMELPDRRWRWFIVIALFSALSHPLVEARYYIPAFFLIHILRPKLPYKTEMGLLIFYIMISAYLLYGTTTEQLFL